MITATNVQPIGPAIAIHLIPTRRGAFFYNGGPLISLRHVSSFWFANPVQLFVCAIVFDMAAKLKPFANCNMLIFGTRHRVELLTNSFIHVVLSTLLYMAR